MGASRESGRVEGWTGYLLWGLSGFLLALSAIAILSIGIFILPVAIVTTVLVSRRVRARPESLGLVVGVALVAVYLLAWMATA